MEDGVRVGEMGFDEEAMPTDVLQDTHLPVIQNNIRSPYVAAGYANGVEAIVVFLFPGEVGIHPHLADPQVGSQDLVSLILVKGHEHISKALRHTV